MVWMSNGTQTAQNQADQGQGVEQDLDEFYNLFCFLLFLSTCMVLPYFRFAFTIVS